MAKRKITTEGMVKSTNDSIAEPRQGRIDAVYDGRVLANKGFALAVRALGILLGEVGLAESCNGRAHRVELYRAKRAREALK